MMLTTLLSKTSMHVTIQDAAGSDCAALFAFALIANLQTALEQVKITAVTLSASPICLSGLLPVFVVKILKLCDPKIYGGAI
jgi:hypothetical protein